ncbi:MAG: tetratricopeptide repeat protein, partial [Bacteroidia bacterium]
MTFRFTSIYMLPLAAGLVLSACGTSKKSVQNNSQQQADAITSKLSVYKQMEFDRSFFDGIKEKMSGNNQRALQSFANCVKVDPNSSAAHYELARTYLQLSQLPDAEAEALKAVKLEDNNKWYKLLLAEVYKYQKKLAPATEMYEKVTQQNPEDAEYYMELANLYLYQNKPTDALKVYDRMEKQFGTNEDISLQRHRIYLETGKTDKAIEEVNKLIKADPQNISYQYILAETYLTAKQEAKAFEIYESLLQKNPNDGKTQLFVAEYYFRRGDKVKGVETLKKAFAIKSLDLDQKIKILYTQYLMPEGVPEDVKKDAYELTEILVKTHSNDAKVHAIHGDFLYQDKKLEEAREAYRKSVAIKKDIFAVWQQIFFINNELRDSKSQEKETGEALEYFPSNSLIYFFNGLAKNELKKHKEATEILESGLALNVDNPALELQYYISLGEANYRLKRYSEMDAYFDKALTLDPNNSLALNNYAYYLS